MRHKYSTRAIVLGRRGRGEANLSLTLLTEDIGMVEARAQSARRPAAKFAAALQTLAESEVMLVRGKEGWRIAGAILKENWFTALARPSRTRAGRFFALLARLSGDEQNEVPLYPLAAAFLAFIATATEEDQDAAEIFVVLKLLAALGLDAGEAPEHLDAAALETVRAHRASYVARINRGIEASGL